MLDAFGDEKALDQEATSHDGQEKKLQAQILANMAVSYTHLTLPTTPYV